LKRNGEPANGKGNGCGGAHVFGSTLSQKALGILAGLTPGELRALDRHVRSMCLYGKDEIDAMRGARKLHDAAEAA
jgi:hypothetical protein